MLGSVCSAVASDFCPALVDANHHGPPLLITTVEIAYEWFVWNILHKREVIRGTMERDKWVRFLLEYVIKRGKFRLFFFLPQDGASRMSWPTKELVVVFSISWQPDSVRPEKNEVDFELAYRAGQHFLKVLALYRQSRRESIDHVGEPGGPAHSTVMWKRDSSAS